MNDDTIVLFQRLIDGVVVSVCVSSVLLEAMQDGNEMATARGFVVYRMRRATPQEKQDLGDGFYLAKQVPV